MSALAKPPARDLAVSGMWFAAVRASANGSPELMGVTVSGAVAGSDGSGVALGSDVGLEDVLGLVVAELSSLLLQAARPSVRARAAATAAAGRVVRVVGLMSCSSVVRSSCSVTKGSEPTEEWMGSDGNRIEIAIVE